MKTKVVFADDTEDTIYDRVVAHEGFIVCANVEHEKSIVKNLTPGFPTEKMAEKVMYPAHRIHEVRSVEGDHDQ